jgi:hypothetical protein
MPQQRRLSGRRGQPVRCAAHFYRACYHRGGDWGFANPRVTLNMIYGDGDGGTGNDRDHALRDWLKKRHPRGLAHPELAR